MNRNELLVYYSSDGFKAAQEICRQANLEDLIGDRQKKIFLKPNLVVSRPASEGATTHPELAEGLIVYLKDSGFTDISIMEGSWMGDQTARAFKACGYEEISKRYGTRLIDTQKEPYKEVDCRGLPLNVCSSVFEYDFMINMPVIKGHCQTHITCALKNNKGLIPNTEKRRFHTMGLHAPIAHLNTALRNDFVLADGICGDLNFEEGGTPVPMNRIIAARDHVLCDAYVCRLLGYEIKDVPYIGLAAGLEVGSADLSLAKIIEINTPQDTVSPTSMTRKTAELARHTHEEMACSACYAALIHALDRLKDAGELNRLPSRICIGQGWKHKEGDLGVGACTARFKKTAKGCPPTASDILTLLKSEIRVK